MPNPVVSFEVRGPEPEVLHRFYKDVFGWDVFVWGRDYAGLDTAVHVHDEKTGATTYIGDDAYMNAGVEVSEQDGHHGWRYKGETEYREFAPGISGGIAQAPGPAVIFYIQVADVAGTLATVEAHGGKTVREPIEVIPGLTIASFRDPAGNEIGLSHRG